MANVKQGGIIAKKQQETQVQAQQTQKQSVAAIMNGMLDSSGIKTRINELLKERAPQFVGSMVSLVNATPQMQQAFREAPMTIIQAGLKAATYGLPVENSLGFGYILPFKNKQSDGSYRMEAQFLIGYKGLLQLALRTGAYSKINVVDVRESELKSWNRLTEDIEIEFIEDDAEREAKPIIGYCGYMRLVNGMEKIVYWSVERIAAHEKRHRKGQYQSPVWRTDPQSMSRKTVLRDMISHWGILSIDYRIAAPDVVALAENTLQGNLDDDDTPIIDIAQEQVETSDGRVVDTTTGEVQEQPSEALFDAQ